MSLEEQDRGIKEIYDREYERVYRTALIWLKNIQDARDAVQNIFIKLLENPRTFESEEQEKAWFITVTKNYCKDILKSSWRRRVDLGEIPERAREDGEIYDVMTDMLKLPCEKYHSRKQKEGIQDTFRKLSGWAESEKKLEFLLSGSRTMYSENSYETENADGEKVLNFLTLQGEKYRLYQCNMQTKQIQVHKLYLTAVERKDRTLPEFEYTGDNAALAAIIAYQQEKWIQSGNEGQFVPEYVIFKEVQKGNEYLVFGNFYEEGYRKVGNLLQSLSGGEMPACFHLKKEGEHYQVVKVDRAGDGAYYAKGIRKFTGDYPGLYERFMDSEELARQHKKVRKKYLRMYVKEHDLEVKGYKDFGWDPEDIDGDR